MKLEFVEDETGIPVPWRVSLSGDLLSTLFEYPDDDGERILLDWFRASRARWCAAQRAKERREVFRVVDGDAG